MKINAEIKLILTGLTIFLAVPVVFNPSWGAGNIARLVGGAAMIIGTAIMLARTNK